MSVAFFGEDIAPDRPNRGQSHLHAATWTSVDTYEIRDDARRFENWETNFAGKLGLTAAVDYALDLGLDNIWPRIQEVSGEFRAGLERIPGVTVTDDGLVKSGIVTFYVDKVPSADVAAAFRESKINVTVSDLEIARLDLETRGLPELVRASVHYYNTESEVEQVCAAVSKLATT